MLEREERNERRAVCVREREREEGIERCVCVWTWPLKRGSE